MLLIVRISSSSTSSDTICLHFRWRLSLAWNSFSLSCTASMSSRIFDIFQKPEPGPPLRVMMTQLYDITDIFHQFEYCITLFALILCAHGLFNVFQNLESCFFQKGAMNFQVLNLFKITWMPSFCTNSDAISLCFFLFLRHFSFSCSLNKLTSAAYFYRFRFLWFLAPRTAVWIQLIFFLNSSSFFYAPIPTFFNGFLKITRVLILNWRLNR